MRSLQDEIRRIQKELVCPVCFHPFNLKDLKVVSSGSSKVEVSAICSKGHFPVILVLPITLQELQEAGPITRKELTQINRQIEALETTFKNKNGNN